MISTKNVEENKQESRKSKIAKLREYHQPTFDHLGIPNAYFYPKLAYKPKELNGETCISFFPSELRKGDDIYTEFVSTDYKCEDPKRTLWKYHFNPHWKDEYEPTDSAEGSERYLVPIDQLEKIPHKKPKKEEEKIDELDKIEDLFDTEEGSIVHALNVIGKNLERIANALEKI